MIRKLIPRLREYEVWQYSSENAPATSTPRPCLLTWSEITVENAAELGSARAGYTAAALRYLEQGHRGILLRLNGELASVGWFAINDGERVTRVKGYYPLRPGHSLLHADWTDPIHRGKGLHAVTIAERVRLIGQINPESLVEVNIQQENQASVRNYARAGFRQTGRLVVLSWARIRTARFAR